MIDTELLLHIERVQTLWFGFFAVLAIFCILIGICAIGSFFYD